jgi:hypothetical protein
LLSCPNFYSCSQHTQGLLSSVNSGSIPSAFTSTVTQFSESLIHTSDKFSSVHSMTRHSELHSTTWSSQRWVKLSSVYIQQACTCIWIWVFLWWLHCNAESVVSCHWQYLTLTTCLLLLKINFFHKSGEVQVYPVFIYIYICVCVCVCVYVYVYKKRNMYMNCPEYDNMILRYAVCSDQRSFTLKSNLILNYPHWNVHKILYVLLGNIRCFELYGFWY